MSQCSAKTLRDWPIPARWLRERVTIEQAERDNLHDGKPFGKINDRWRDLLAKRLDRDELWRYDSGHGWGMAGYVLVRDCRVVENLVTAIYD